MRLLPFPWVIATRRLARRMIEHIEGLNRIIARQQAEIVVLHSRLNETERAGKR